jgi:hypothetical protein
MRSETGALSCVEDTSISRYPSIIGLARTAQIGSKHFFAADELFFAAVVVGSAVNFRRTHTITMFIIRCRKYRVRSIQLSMD